MCDCSQLCMNPVDWIDASYSDYWFRSQTEADKTRESLANFLETIDGLES